MAERKPGFMFYPGDYLRDTQCLSEKSQVAYDRIMCEHMRNKCVTKERLNFFIKKLTDDEKDEIFSVLEKKEDGFYIQWVVESIVKYEAFSESRRKNRTKTHENISSSSDEHLESEDESDNSINIEFEIFWNLYDKKRGDKTKLTKKWNKLKDSDRVLIMQHIPKYKTAQPDKQYRKDPETYLNNSGWLDEIIGIKAEEKQQEGVSDILKRHGK